MGGLGLCAAACLLAPASAVAGAATFATVVGGTLAGIGQGIGPNITADLYSRFADWTAKKFRDPGATLGDLLGKQGRWQDAAAAYVLGAEIYRKTSTPMT